MARRRSRFTMACWAGRGGGSGAGGVLLLMMVKLLLRRKIMMRRHLATADGTGHTAAVAEAAAGTVAALAEAAVEIRADAQHLDTRSIASVVHLLDKHPSLNASGT